MLELRRESMSTFIANARIELDRLWEDLMYGKEERESFPPYSDGKRISLP
jgi:protein regulator of cytokinesis 1